MKKRTFYLVAGLLVAAPSASALVAASSSQSATSNPPSAPPQAGQHGFMMVGERGIAFVPAQASAATPVPLLILFHGAGGAAQDMMKPFLLEADKRGIALLAVQSKGVTWDLIKTHFSDVSQEATMLNARDRLPAVDRRIAETTVAAFTKVVPVDAKRIGAFGFSDGAAYALSYGAANSGSIAWVGAVAPAFATIERGARSKGQRIYIAHGKDDEIIAPGMSQSGVCPEFVKFGWAVRYEIFAGGHVIPPAIASAMLDDWLDPAARPATTGDQRCSGASPAKR
ncbi:MAG: hypothetical protein ABIO29_04885 [Sphingomicrobium sp.]